MTKSQLLAAASLVALTLGAVVLLGAPPADCIGGTVHGDVYLDGSYQHLTVTASVCLDGGVWVTGLPPGALVAGGMSLGTGTYGCACSPGPGCLALDGGAAPRGMTLQPGTYAGVCQPKVCVELMGLNSWPTQCGAQ